MRGTLRVMNTEYVWWFLILVVVGIGVVGYLALGPVPEIEAGPGRAPDDGTAARRDEDRGDEDRGDEDRGRRSDPDQGAPGDASASVPISTSLPGPAEPASTSDTP